MQLHRRLRLGSLVSLTLLWLLMWGSWGWGTFFMGLAMGALVLVAFPMPRASTRLGLRPLAMVWLVVTFLANLFLSSFIVASMAFRPRGVSQGRVVAMRLHETDDFRRTVVAELTSLVPGTVVIDLDDHGHMLIHIIDATDDARLRREANRIHRLERRVARAFGAPPLFGCGWVDEQQEVHA